MDTPPSPTDDDSAYSDNVVTNNTTGTVSGGQSRGGNLCFGPGVSSTLCP